MKEKGNKQRLRSFMAALLALVLAFSPVLSSIPAIQAEAADAKIWYHVETGSGNGNAHTYSDASTSPAAVLLHRTATMPADGTFSVTYEKQGDNTASARLGFFYTYVDDSNFLYVGFDTQSHWFYEYKVNGGGSYSTISGLPDQTDGSRTDFSISVSREALTVKVNDTIKSVNVQDFVSLMEKAGGNGRFGFRGGNPTSFHFTDAKVNNEAVSNEWEFLADCAGQTFQEEVPVPVYTVTGTVKNTANQPIAGANVRIGYSSTKTDAAGSFSIDVEEGTYDVTVSAAGYAAQTVSGVEIDSNKSLEAVSLVEKAAVVYKNYIQKDSIKAAVSEKFPQVMQYKLNVDGNEKVFAGQEDELSVIKINGVAITPVMGDVKINADNAVYPMTLKKDSIDMEMTVKISVKENDLTWEVTDITKKEGCAKIHTIEVPDLNLVTISDEQKDAQFMGANVSGNVQVSGDEKITFDEGFSANSSAGYAYGFLSADGISAGVWSNSEMAGDKRLVRNNSANSMSLTSALWYYEYGDLAASATLDGTPVSELPSAKVCLAGDENRDGTVDWQDGAIAYRDIMNNPYGSENTKDLVNYRISMNFSSQATNPYLKTADNIKKVYLATDGLPQAVMMKGYGSEGHDSANSEYGKIADRLGGLEELKKLNSIAHQYHTQMGIHINAQEVYPEAQSFTNELINGPSALGWGWLDQSYTINRPYDLASGLRYKRLLQLYDQLNGTSLYANKWPGVVGTGTDETVADAETIAETVAEKKLTTDENLDFMYLDVWYGDSWETRKIAQQINSLGWRFSTEFGYEGEYDSTWQHWATEGHYGGSSMKGLNSDVIRFIRNHQKDSFVLNYPYFNNSYVKGANDNPLLGGFTLTGFEGWGGSNDSFNTYMTGTFAENLPTKFLQHYLVYKWENYEDGQSPAGNHEKQITLKNEAGDTVVVTRKEEQREDNYIERIITLNGKKVLEDVTYLLPWTDSDTNKEKLYHYNYEGGTTTWELQDDWADLKNVIVYKLTDTGRTEEQTVAVVDGTVTLTAEANTPYVVVKGEEAPKTVTSWSNGAHVKDTGFNSYAGTGAGDALDENVWSGDVKNDNVKVVRVATGNKYLSMGSEEQGLEVTTAIKDLTPGKNYVAEVYVDNKSDAKAWIEVAAGTETVSNYTLKSFAGNYVQCDAHNNRGMANSNMQVMLVSFTAEKAIASLTLKREAGTGITYFDDIRIVEKTLNNIQEDGSFKQDFEEVVQGIYPFVIGSAQGVTDQVTHLAEKHDPYTQSGWGNVILDDVIGGTWSLKHHGNNSGIIYQTIPQNLHLEPGVTYKVSFDYQAGRDNMYRIVTGDGDQITQTFDYLAGTAASAVGGKSTTGKCEFTITGSGTGQSWFGLSSTSFTEQKGVDYCYGQKDFILDNLVVTPQEGLTLNETDVELKGVGDSRKLTASQEVTWSTSDENVVTVGTDGYIQAAGAGTATITATAKTNTALTASCTITVATSSEVVNESPFEAVAANTEQGGDEGKEKAIDGNTSTHWHSNWSTGFTVSETNPAILTATLKDDAKNFGGFYITQRLGNVNGLISKLAYVAGNTFDAATNTVSDVVKEGTVEVPSASVSAGATFGVPFDANVNAKYLQIRVLNGGGNFAAIAELRTCLKVAFTDEELLEEKQNAKTASDAAATTADEALTNAQTDLTAAKAAEAAAEDKVAANVAVKEAELAVKQAELNKQEAVKRQQEAAVALALMEASQSEDAAVKQQKLAAAETAKTAIAAAETELSTLKTALAVARYDAVNAKSTLEVQTKAAAVNEAKTVYDNTSKPLTDANSALDQARAAKEEADKTGTAFEKAEANLNLAKAELAAAEAAQNQLLAQAAWETAKAEAAAARANVAATAEEITSARNEEKSANEAAAAARVQIANGKKTISACNSSLAKAEKVIQDLKSGTEELAKALEKAEDIYKAGGAAYTEASWKKFVTAYENAKAAVGDTSKDPDELYGLQKALEDAQKALEEKKPDVQDGLAEAKKALTETLKAADAVYAAGGAAYTEASWKAFAAAYAAAKNPAANADAAALKALAEALKKAQSGLVKAAAPAPAPTEKLKKGDTVTVKNVVYKVTNADKKTVAAVKGKNKKLTSVSIASTVKVKGVTCKVTAVNAKAFKGYAKLKKVTIGKNVTTVGKQAFYGCKKLTKVSFKGTAVKSIKSAAFKKANAKIKVTLPKKLKGKNRTKLVKQLKKAGIKSAK